MSQNQKEAGPDESAKGSKTPRVGAPMYVVESVDSALRILRMLGEEEKLRVSEVAQRLGVAQSTAHRLLSMLVHHGFARQDERRREYRTGPAFLGMGFAAIQQMEVRQHARSILQEIQNEVNETIHLALPYGQQVFYVEGIESTRQLRVGSRVGSFVPAHCVGVGKALLATLPLEEFRALYPHQDLPPLTENSVRTRDKLERQLEEARALGYARSRGESDDGVGSLAVAVHDRRGAAKAGISISAPTARIAPEKEAQWIDVMKRAASQLQLRVWGPPEPLRAEPRSDTPLAADAKEARRRKTGES